MLRKLKPLEVFYEVGQKHGVLITGYHVTLRTSKTVTENMFQLGASFLFKRVPTFRVSIQEKDGDLWFNEMDEEIIDFQVKCGNSVEEEMREITHAPFDSSKGPLWRLRLLRDSSTSSRECESSAFHFGYELLFGFHHAITDGFSNLKIIELFVQILENIIAERPVEEGQLGIFCSGDRTKLLLEERRKELEGDPSEFDRVKKEVQDAFFSFNTLWIDSFGIQDEAENKTIHLSREMDEEITWKLRDKFKLHNISLNSVMCAVANVVIMDMMRDTGNTRDIFNIGALHGVNLRQYWPKDERVNLGLHIGMMRIYFETSEQNVNNFWQYAGLIHKTIRGKLASKWCLNEEIVQASVMNNDMGSLHKLFTNENPHHTILYAGSSLGNVDNLVISSTKNIQWTSLSRSTSVHLMGCPLSINYQIFRNRLIFSVGYVTRYVTPEIANITATKIQQKIRFLTES